MFTKNNTAAEKHFTCSISVLCILVAKKNYCALFAFSILF